ncbi:MAG TPA: hypothetical protein VGI93_18100 [Steroidobacteraceae bacterium]|jgi:hypothetical protein
MKIPSFSRNVILSVCALGAALSLTSTPALAQHARFYGGWHGGWHGGGWGWGRGWHGGWGPWGWGWGGLGLGLYFATLPYAYSTYYWGGVPYYYANYTYYRWDAGAGQYVTVAPPAGIASQAATQAPANAPGAPSQAGLIVYPKNGQSEDQTNKDKFECHKWAVGQTGFDPTQPNGGSAPGAGNKRSDYFRAQSACLEGRGYSVK